MEYLFEYSHVEKLLEFLVAVVDAELLKAVCLEVLWKEKMDIKTTGLLARNEFTMEPLYEKTPEIRKTMYSIDLIRISTKIKSTQEIVHFHQGSNNIIMLYSPNPAMSRTPM